MCPRFYTLLVYFALIILSIFNDGIQGIPQLSLLIVSFNEQGKHASLLMALHRNLDTYPWALRSGALDPLAQHLTPFTHAELTTRAVPHIAMVTDDALIEAAAFRRDTIFTALAGSLDLCLTLRRTHVSKHYKIPQLC